MISGRGLGITSGTIDKLESIEGYSAGIGEEKLKNMLNDTGFFIIGQTERLVPADRQLYKYRDVTGTVASVPLVTGNLFLHFNQKLLILITSSFHLIEEVVRGPSRSGNGH